MKQNKEMSKRARVVSSVILLALLAFVIYRAVAAPAWKTYPAFQQEVTVGLVSEANVIGGTVFYTTVDGASYKTNAPSDASFRDRLLAAGVRVTVVDINTILLLAIIAAAAVGLLVFKRTGTKTKAKGFSIGEAIPQTRFTDVAAQEEAVDSMKGLVEFIKDPEKYEKFGARIPRGMLLYGPPGTGKTLLARALAGEAGVPFFNVCGADFVQMYVGVGASRVRDLFRKVRQAGKAVLFIDEIDALGRRRDSGHGNEEREQTLNALLTEMSGFRGDQGIVVLAATNRADILDEALMRPGRFDRQVEVGLPTKNQRLKILQVHAKNKPIAQDVDLDKLAYNSVYFSGAKLESLLNEAAIRAARRNADKIENTDIEHSFETVMVGEQKQDRSGISERERTITAYHEAGHALATARLLPESKLTRLSIIPSTKGMAGYSMAIAPDRMFQTKAELEANIAIALAGRAAEELAFGARQVTTGASSDLARATELCIRIIGEWGMDDETGLPVKRVLSQYGMNGGNDNLRVKAYMETLYNVVKKLLDGERETLTRLAEALLSEEVLTGERIEEIVG